MLQVVLIANMLMGLLCIFARKKGKIVSLLILIFLMFNFTAAQSTVDSYAYSNAFNMISDGKSFEYVNNFRYGIDFGFLVVMKLVSTITVEYINFRAIVFAISMFIIIISMKKIDDSTIIAICLYMLFPFEYDAFQIEFFFAYSIVTYGLVLLIKNEKHCLKKYILLVSFATFIHKYAIMFFVFLIFKLNSGQLRKLITRLTIAFLILNIFLRINLVSVVNKLLPLFNEMLSLGHYVEGDNLNILTIIMSITLFLSLYYYSFTIRDYSDEAHNLFLINSISLLFLPFIFTSLNFERYFRPLLIINYTFMNYTATLQRKKQRWIEFAIVAMVIFRFSLHWNYYVSNNNDILQYILHVN